MKFSKLSTKISTICWFHFVKRKLCLSTIVAVQEALDPADDRLKLAVCRKWGDYKNGLHKPSKKIVQLTEKKVPNSSIILDHVIWRTMRVDNSPVPIAKILIGQCSKDADQLIHISLKPSCYKISANSVRKTCRRITKLGTLTSLAVLTICFRLSTRIDPTSWLTVTLFSELTICLKVLGVWFLRLNIADLIADYYANAFLIDDNWVFISRFKNSDYVGTMKDWAHYLDEEQTQCKRVYSDKLIIAKSYQKFAVKKRRHKLS